MTSVLGINRQIEGVDLLAGRIRGVLALDPDLGPILVAGVLDLQHINLGATGITLREILVHRYTGETDHRISGDTGILIPIITGKN